ncbi:uncharacterized protein C2845_PM12G14740 [Panicum miliaceum]|uniref:Ubiquitin-like protease family profile domain-containing protein n=1 Tax=Panicum miliaceum TaxID=4540 RepID=A0A3L6QIM2_PANMI|nr:uncharacterized protein C2845_PM12G14740 [Panicum miliaceum]
MKLKNRRKALRLDTPPPRNTASQDIDEEDSNFVLASDDEVGDAAKGSNRRGAATRRAVILLATPQPLPLTPALGVGIDPKKRPISIRCSPSKFIDIVKSLDVNLKGQVRAKNFGGLLSFNPHTLDRQLLSWLMRKLNPETMELEIGSDKEIPIIEHNVWCVFQFPNVGSDSPRMTDAEAHLKQRALGAQICGNAYNPKVGIKDSDILRGFKNRTLTRALGLRAFFVCAFQSLLFSNTNSYIRIEDVRNSEDLENIGTRNWCKAVVDNLSKASRLYKKDFEEKGINAPITGCGIFLTMLYVDNVQHGLDTRTLNPFSLPRCAFLDMRIIGTLWSVTDTCYSLPPATAPAVAPAAAPAPQVDHGSSTAAGTSTHGVGTSHDPGGHAATNLQPPTIYRYPIFSASFGQSIADVVGRSRKSEALQILKTFDDSTNQAQSIMAKDHISEEDTLGSDACGSLLGDVPNIGISTDVGSADKQTIKIETASHTAPPDPNRDVNVTTKMEMASRTATPEPNKEPDRDALSDVHSKGHATADDTSRSTNTRELAENRDVANKTTEIEQETLNKEVDGAAIGDVPNLRTSASVGTSDDISGGPAHPTSYVVTPTGNDTTDEQLAPHSKVAAASSTPDPMFATGIHSEGPIQKQAAQVPIAYNRRSTRSTRAADILKTQAAEAKKAKEPDAAVKKEEKQLEAARKKAEADKKKEETKKQKQQKGKAAGKNKRAKLQLTKDDQALCDEHEKRLMQLRKHANEEISKLKRSVPCEECERGSQNFNEFQKTIFKHVGERLRKKPRKYISPFNIPGCPAKVPLAKALATRNKIASDEKLKASTLVDFSIFCAFDSHDLLTTFADDKDGVSSIMDFTVHCLRYDDIIHKEDSMGYNVFLTTGFFVQAKGVEKVYMDDGKTETEEFKILRQCLESEIEHYSDITKAKLIFMHVCAGKHYFVYCINLIHNRIDILDSIDYFWAGTSPKPHHQSIYDKLPIINAAFQKGCNCGSKHVATDLV